MELSYILHNILKLFRENNNDNEYMLIINKDKIPINLKNINISLEDKILQIKVINKNTNEEETYTCELIEDCHGRLINIGKFYKVK